MPQNSGELDHKRFLALAEELRQRPAAARVADQLKKVEKELRRMRGEGRGYNEMWEICKRSGLICSYAHFVKSLRAVLENNVKPLDQARSRAKARGPGIPRTPLSLTDDGLPAASARNTAGRAGSRTADARSRLVGVSALELEAARVNRGG